MRALLFSVLLLAACASSHGASSLQRSHFADVTTRDEFMFQFLTIQLTDAGIDVAKIPQQFMACSIYRQLAVFTPEYLQAVDQYLADKSDANWQRLKALDAQGLTLEQDRESKKAVQDCKKQAGMI